MKKLLFSAFLLSLLAQGGISADEGRCLEILTQNHHEDSRSFSLSTDNIIERRDFRNDHLAQSILTIRMVLEEAGCHKKDINFSKGPWGRSTSICKVLIPGKAYSEVCYVESSLGYFLVTNDFQNKTHIIFNRWD